MRSQYYKRFLHNTIDMVLTAIVLAYDIAKSVNLAWHSCSGLRSRTIASQNERAVDAACIAGQEGCLGHPSAYAVNSGAE
jgi:hypothetical protein